MAKGLTGKQLLAGWDEIQRTLGGEMPAEIDVKDYLKVQDMAKKKGPKKPC